MKHLDKLVLKIGNGKVFQMALAAGVYGLGAGAYLFIGIPIKKLQGVWRRVRKPLKRRYRRSRR